MPEDDKTNDAQKQRETSLKEFVFGHLPLEAETTMFVLVNMIDFFMTYWLLASGMFRESNPVASYFLNHWGPVKGMLYFKLGLVVIVCVVAQLIALKDVKKARWVLNFGTVAVVFVVLYSLSMYLKQTGI